MPARRLITRVLAAAFLIVVMQQFAPSPLVRRPVRIELRASNIAGIAETREQFPAKISPWGESPAERITATPDRHGRPTPGFLARYWQRPPPVL